MKIYFNRKPVQGPWGGGTKVLSAIVDECLNRGHQVLFEEQIKSENNIDLLVCMDPRPNQNVNFSDLLEYKNKFGKKLIQRVGDLGTHGKPELFELVKKTSDYSDVIIFPSNWAKKYLNLPTHKNSRVILNAPLDNFVTYKKIEKLKEYDKGKIKVITHHWSDNPKKGFDIYTKFDKFCQNSEKFEFTYIGRKPYGVSFMNEIPPLGVEQLVDELQNHHVYLTASRQEAGANHVLEAMGMNIPVLYHADGGSIVEYCKEYGYVYQSIEELIYILENSMKLIKEKFLFMNYKRNSIIMAYEYVDLFESLI